MGESVTRHSIEQFAHALSARISAPSDLFLIGGAALLLFGSPRATQDIDVVGSDGPPGGDPWRIALAKTITEARLDVEAVPFETFVPLLKGGEARHRMIGTYGQVRLWVFDPVAIALSKLDRGFETDLEDIEFMLRQGIITRQQMLDAIEEAAPRARAFDFDINQMRQRLAALLVRLK